jgi:hypothetical protein
VDVEFQFHFPDGRIEQGVRDVQSLPSVGDRFSEGGRSWVVREVEPPIMEGRTERVVLRLEGDDQPVE